LHVSEHQAEPIQGPTDGETGSLGAGQAAPGSTDASSTDASSTDALIEKVMASAQAAARVEAPAIAPDQEETAPKPDAAKVEPVMLDAGKVDVAKPEAARSPGKLMIVSPGERAWEKASWENVHADAKVESESASAAPGKRRFGAMAAVVALATVAGAVGGALATAGLAQFTGTAAAVAGNPALEASVARIDADVLALKAGLEHAARTSLSQFNKTNDRLDKVEKAQAEPAAKLAKLSEAVEKLHTPPAAAPAPVAAAPAAPKDVTGSVTPPAGAAPLPVPAASPVAAVTPKTEVGRLPTVDGWVLRDVARGGALIEGRSGLYEVYAGDPVPGLGRVDAIRKQDGRWVVVTSKGLVVAR
jgi:hypothetical protein